MAITAADWTITDATKAIRYIGDDHDGASPSYATVIEMHRWLQDKADDAVWSGDDEMDITRQTPSERSTDNIIKLINGYNFDAKAIEHLYDGSVTQGSGPTEERWDGIVNFGNADVVIQVLQNGVLLSDDYWNQSGPAGLNADATNGISHRFMIKVREDGVDIDGRRLIGLNRTYGNTYGEFKINGTNPGNNVFALADSSDLNNATARATVAGWTTIVNTEGLRLIDIDNDTTDEEYYSEWDRGSQTINDFYERGKWLQATDNVESSNTDTGSDFAVGNGTITEQGQSFAMGSNNMFITEVSFWLAKVLSPTGNATAELYAHTGTFGSTGTPTGATLATSDPVDVADIDAATGQATFHFPTPVELTASTNYFVAIKYSGGDASNYINVNGLASSGTHAGNRAQNAAGWSAAGTDDLRFSIGSSPKLNGLPGTWFRGLTHSMAYDGETGTMATTNDELVWGTAIAYDGGSGTFEIGEAIHEDTATPVWKGRIIAHDDNTGTGTLIVAIEEGTVLDPSSFTGQSSGATADVNVTPTAVTGGGRIRFMAIDDDGLAGNLYGQLINGTTPGDDVRLYDDLDVANYVDVNGAPTDRSISTPFVGSSTGSALIGAYGLGMQKADTASTDKFFDLQNTEITPPNNVTYSILGLEVSEDYIHVTNNDAGNIDFNQLTLNVTLNGNAETQATMSASIPTDTPSSGTIRIEMDDGRYRLVNYSSFSGAVFTFTSSEDFDPDSATATKNVYISYLDKVAASATETFQYVYNTDRTHFVRARDGAAASPIKTFETTGVMGSTGGSSTVIRTPDV